MLSKLPIIFASLLFCSTGIAQSPFEPFTGTVTGTKVRLRTHPSLEGHVVRETNYGEFIAVIGEEEGYYAVSPSKGTKGYIFRTFVLDGVVEGEHVNVRLYPDIEAPVVAQLNTGDQIESVVCDTNNKWLVIDLPKESHFYIANEYCERCGPIELLAQMEARQTEAAHKLHAAFLYAQTQIQKPLQAIDLDSVNTRFEALVNEYGDLDEIVDNANEASRLIQEVYVQKKIAFLESKADHKAQVVELNSAHVEKLASLGIHIKQTHEESDFGLIGEASATTIGLAATLSDENLTDKMRAWEPLEEALYHLWAATNGDRSIEEFYREEGQEAIVLSGFIEPYNRPVKNLPGDFLLRCDNHPVAFLYSTRVNLQHLVGKNITVIAAPRANNNFAFPAYYVLGVE